MNTSLYCSHHLFYLTTSLPASNKHPYPRLSGAHGQDFYFSEHDETTFFPIATKAKLKHPCKSELFHLGCRLNVMLKRMFLISGDGTLKHAAPLPLCSEYINRECSYQRADTRLMKARMIWNYFCLHSCYEHVC